jgi:hypothetical protein
MSKPAGLQPYCEPRADAAADPARNARRRRLGDLRRWIGASKWQPNVAILLGGALVAGAAVAQPAACRTDPFSQLAAAEREQVLQQECGGEHIDWKVETPRAQPVDVGPSLVSASVDTTVSERLTPSTLGTLKLSWAGLRSETEGGLRTERAALAAGSMVRLAEDLALQMDMGHDLTAGGRNRATVAGTWQPTRRSVMFAEWAGSEHTTEMHRVGARWWLLPQRLAFDVGANHLPDSGWNEGRVGLVLSLRL